MKTPMFRIAMAVAFVLTAYAQVNADSAFEGTEGGVSRTALELYGGTVSDIVTAANGNVYVALNSSNGVFCSVDGAATWTPPPAGADFGNINGIAVGENDNTVYFIGGINLYKMTGPCTAFTQLNDSEEIADFGSAIVYGSGVLLAEMRNSRLARSEDEGSSFSPVTIVEDATEISSLAASPTSGVFFAVVQKGDDQTGYLYESTDFGETWTDTGKQGEFELVGVNPQDGDQVVLVGRELQEYSDDGALSWNDLGSHPIPRSTLDFANSRIYVCGGWTDDFGATWHDLQAEATSTDSTLGWYLAGDPDDNNSAYSASARGVAKTIDNGATWTDEVDGMLGVRIYDIAQSTNKSIVYIAAVGGLAKCENFTDEENRTWDYPITVDGALGDPQALIIDPENPDLVIVGANASIHYSTDGGETWNQAVAPDLTAPRDFAQLSDGSYVVAHGAMPGVASEGGVMRSTDQGQTWTDMAMQNSPPANVIVPVGDEMLVGVGMEFDDNTTTAKGIYRWDGSSWTQLTGPMEGFRIEDMAYSGSIIFAAGGVTGGSGVFRSIDGGETWEDLTDNGLESMDWYHTLAIDPENPTTIYVAAGRPAGNCKIYQSIDSGDTFSLYYEGLRDEVPDVMLVDALTAGLSTGAYEFSNALTSPVYAMWNGFLNMTNILELVNKGSTVMGVTVFVYSIDGVRGQPVSFTIDPQGQHDLVLNSIPQFSADSYGLVQIYYAGGVLDGRVSFYRNSSAYGSGDDYDYAFSVPLESPITGTSYVGFNTFQPSQNPGEQANEVSNWLSVVNLSQDEQEFTVNRYSQTGQLLNSRQISVPALGRQDLDGGHGEGSSVVGLNEIVPANADAQYKAELVRYGADAPAGHISSSYSFAFPLLAKAGGAVEQWVPISSGAGGQNWVEVINTANQATEVTVTFFDNQGNQVLAPQSFELAAHAQQHFNASAVLAQGASGAARIASSQPGQLIAQSMFYFFDAAGGIQAMYGSQAQSALTGELTGSWNLFLGMYNWLRIFNTGPAETEILLTVWNNGEAQEQTVQLGPRTGVDLGLHETANFGTALDSYGMVSVQGNNLSVELLRLKPAGVSGSIDFAAPTKVRP